ncbi:MAG: radical SAM protein [Candidatus Omnitrophica bacterium]|nr:radical SAM protein [Candidatus Omnitrophota bacterium]
MGERIKNIAFIRFPRGGRKNFHPSETIWPISMGIMATMLKQEGFNVKIMDLQAEKNFDISKITESIIEDNADILFILYETISLISSLNFSKNIKNIKNDILIVGFGQHAVALPQEIIKEGGANICISTDPEFVVKDLIHAIQNKRLQDVNNIVYINEERKPISTKKEDTGDNVDALPHIDLSLFKLENYYRKKFPKPFFWGKNWAFIRTSLGCPYKCIFCSPLLRHSITKRYKPHSIEYISSQIKCYKEKFGIRVFSMEDDIFSLDENRTEKLCDAITPLKIKWVVDGARADSLPGRLLDKMRKAGCFGIGIGIESGSQKILNTLNKKQAKSSIKNTALNIKKCGMMLVGYVIIGNPTETEKDLDETVNFVEEIRPHVLYIHYFIPYPGSEAYNIYKERIKEKAFSHYNYSGINLSEVETERLRDFMKYFYKRYYFSWSYFKEYFKGRFRYAVFDFNELLLIRETLNFIIKRH